MFREGLTWLRGHLLGEKTSLPASPVRVFVQGIDAWQEWAGWPPPTEAQEWYLQAEAALATGDHLHPSEQFVYDPAYPIHRWVGPRWLLAPV